MLQRTYPSTGHVLPSGQQPREGLNGHSTRRARPWITAVIMLFTAAVFILDLLTPLGIPYWLLYSIPFFFVRYNTPGHFAYILATVCTILILVGYVLSPGGGVEPLTDRALAVIILWVVTIVVAPRSL